MGRSKKAFSGNQNQTGVKTMEAMEKVILMREEKHQTPKK